MTLFFYEGKMGFIKRLQIIDEELHTSGFFKSVHVDDECEKLTAIKTSTTKKKYAEMKNILNELEKRINRASRQETY